MNETQRTGGRISRNPVLSPTDPDQNAEIVPMYSAIELQHLLFLHSGISRSQNAKPQGTSLPFLVDAIPFLPFIKQQNSILIGE
jgi:hypothetical protein